MTTAIAATPSWAVPEYCSDEALAALRRRAAELEAQGLSSGSIANSEVGGVLRQEFNLSLYASNASHAWWLLPDGMVIAEERASGDLYNWSPEIEGVYGEVTIIDALVWTVHGRNPEAMRDYIADRYGATIAVVMFPDLGPVQEPSTGEWWVVELDKWGDSTGRAVLLHDMPHNEE